MKNHTYIIQLCAIVFLGSFDRVAQAQFVVTSSTEYDQLVGDFMGSGISVSNINYTGSELACGYFSDGDLANLDASAGIVLSTGRVADIDNGALYFGNFALGSSGNVLLTALAGGMTLDAAVLEFDVVPDNDTLSFSFIYGSEDYPEWVGGSPLFQDHFGAFISGTNPTGGNYSNQNFVVVPNTNLPVVVNNINANFNSQYFVNNPSGPVMFDGYTTLLEAKIPVVPSVSYHVTIAIADGGDQTSDSGVFLKSQSLRSYGDHVGISESERQQVFQFYPNPATDRLFFRTTERGTLTITSQLGQLIKVAVVNESQTQMALDNLQSGIYF